MLFLVIYYFMGIFLILLGLWYIHMLWARKGLRNIPGPTPLPFIGNAHKFSNTVELLRTLTEYERQYKSRTIKYTSGMRTFLITTDYKFMEHIHNQVLEKSDVYLFLTSWLGTGLLTSGGEKWKKHRRMLTPTFHFSILEKYIDVFAAASDILVKQLKKEIGKPYFDVYKYVNLCAMDIICESAMGVSVNAQTKDSAYLLAVKTMCQIVVKRIVSPITQYWWYYIFTQTYRDEVRHLKVLHGHTYAIIRKRRDALKVKGTLVKEGKDAEDVGDESYGMRKKMVFLDMLLQATIDGKPLTDEEIREEVDTFMFEGHDTITSAISFAVHCLATHPQYQAKVLAEQRELFGQDRGRRVTYKDLQEMRYLEMFIKEVLRLYPSVPIYFRDIRERQQYESMTLDPRLVLGVFVFGLQRNPDHFPNPLVFDPERFNPSNNLGKFPYSFIPFSAGPRNCIEQGFYYNGPQARFLPNYQQTQQDYIHQQPDHSAFRQTSPGFQQLDAYFPHRGDLQTSDLPVHLQQTLPQYRYNGQVSKDSFEHFPATGQHPKDSLEHYPATGQHPAPFRPQHNAFASVITPSTHRPNYSHLFKNHHTDDTETFLGQITLESPADLPPDYNNAPFKPSLDFPRRNKVVKKPVNQNLDESTKNTISLGTASFLNHRTRIFAPTTNQDSDFKNKPQVKDYFVNVNGDVYATGKTARSTTPYPITTLVRRDRYNPLLYKPTEGPSSFDDIPRRRKITTPHTFDLESLLEEPIDESKTAKQNDDVQVIKSVTVPPDQFYTVPPANINSKDSNSAETITEDDDVDEEEEGEATDYEYDTTEDVTETSAEEQMLNDLEHETNDIQNEEPRNKLSNVSDIGDNSLKSKDDKGYDVLTMKPSTMVKDDNFKEFVDSTVIDTSEDPNTTTKNEVDTTSSEANHIEPKISVVTTKSVINSTIIGTVTPSPKPLQQITSPVSTDDSSESWVVVASVQTSRSVSGARYLPSAIVEQEERTKLLNEQSEEEVMEDDTTTVDNLDVTTNVPDTSVASSTGKTKTSTESLIDKLDRVQSDLSSGLLTDGFKPSGNNIAVLTENMQEKGETTVLDMEMTTPSVTTTVRAVVPPVVIKKFMPNARPTYKPKFQTRPKSTTTIQPEVDMDLPQGDEPIKPNNDTLMSKVVAPDLRKFLPVGYTRQPNLKETQPKTIADILNIKTTPKPAPIKTIDDLLEKVKIADISSLLPPGYKPPKVETPKANKTIVPPVQASTSSTTTKPLVVVKTDDISAFLPPGFKLKEQPEETTTPTTTSSTSTEKVEASENKTTDSNKKLDIFKDIKEDDISSFLPPGYKNFKKTITTTTEKPVATTTSATTEKPENKTKSKLDTLLSEAVPMDISKFLPPGYKPRTTTTKKPATSEVPVSTSQEPVVNATTEITVTSTKASFKVVFPSRAGGPVRKSSTGRLTTPKDMGDVVVSQPSVTVPTIHKGWPSRATTEFTGWPSPPTTPISIEKLLEAAREAAAAAAAASTAEPTSSTFTTVPSTTTSTTSTTTQQPTTPGLCKGECDLAGTIKLVGGAKWVPELLDRNTKEWQILANEVQSQLEDVYSKSSVLNKWYKRIRIDGFSEGSVLVDYLVELNDLGAQVDTLTIRKLFHESLVEEPAKTAPSNREPKATDLGSDGPDWNRTVTATAGARLGLGNFIVDPAYTDFIVIPKQVQATTGYADENVLLPQWAIAVIVIGLASLLFVIIFGVTVLVNRQKSAKKKQPTPLTEDMLHELNKNHMNGIDNYGAEDLYNMEDVWNDRHPYDTKIPKKRSTGSIHDNSMANLYDSWKSEWNGYYYNNYYGNPHQQPAGSSHSGYGHHGYGRRRSDYDTNF